MFSSVYFSFPSVCIFTPIPHAHFQHNVSFIRWITGEIWGQFTQNISPSDIQKRWTKNYFDIFVLHQTFFNFKSNFFTLLSEDITKHLSAIL